MFANARSHTVLLAPQHTALDIFRMVRTDQAQSTCLTIVPHPYIYGLSSGLNGKEASKSRSLLNGEGGWDEVIPGVIEECHAHPH